MQQHLLTLGLVIVYTLLVTYLINAFINKRFSKLVLNSESTLGLSIVKVTLLVSVGLFLTELPSVIATLSDTLLRQHSGVNFYIETVKFTSLFVGIVLLLMLSIYFLSSGFLSLVTPNSQFKIEVANSNIEKLLIFVGIALLLSLSLKSFLPILLDYFIPYQTIPIIN